MSRPIDNDDRLSLPLDGSAGPAHHITRTKADAMIQRALAEAGFGAAFASTQDHPQPSNEATSTNVRARETPPKIRARRALRTSYLAAAVLVVCATVGSASAAVLWYAKVRGTAPVTTNAPPRGEGVAT